MSNFNAQGALGGAGAGASFGPIGAGAGFLLGGLFGGPADIPQAAPIEFNPANIKSGFGGVSFNQDTELFKTFLNPNVEASRDNFFNTGQDFLGQAQNFDVAGTSRNLSNRLRRMAAPQEERDRLSLENSLFKRGLLTSTLGDDRQEVLGTSQQMAEEQRNQRALQVAQGTQTGLFNRGIQSLDASVALDRLPIGLLQTSIQAGRANAGADIANSANRFESDLFGADARNAMTSSALDLTQRAGNRFNRG